MQTCARCGATVSTGGVWDGPVRYCGKPCLDAGPAGRFVIEVRESVLQQQVWSVHQGMCPRCGGRGPVDLHTSYWVRSIVIGTYWNSRVTLCCEPCGRSVRRRDVLSSLLIGWWGFPFGVVITPLQIARNIRSARNGPDPVTPSAALTDMVHAQLWSQAFENELTKT